MPAFEIPTDLSRLLDPNPGPASLVYVVPLILFLLVLAVGAYNYFAVRPRVKNRLRQHYTSLLSRIAIAIGLVGIFIIILRFMAVPYLSARILTYAWTAITVFYCAFVVYFVYRVQPRRLKEYKEAYGAPGFRPKPRPKKGGKKKRKR